MPLRLSQLQWVHPVQIVKGPSEAASLYQVALDHKRNESGSEELGSQK